MAAAWRWLSSLGLGLATAYATWYLACPSSVSETLPPTCTAAVGWEVPCGWEGWCGVAEVVLGVAVGLVAFRAMRPPPPGPTGQASTP